jgi:hypothetical protein
MSSYRVIQLTNNNIGAVAVTNLLPLGTVTRRVNKTTCGNGDTTTFTLATTDTNTVAINECGNYRITYSLSGVATAAGIMGVTLQVNGVDTYSVNATAAAGDTINLTLPYEIRVLPNCVSNTNNVPANISIQLTGIGITGGTSNILIERVY